MNVFVAGATGTLGLPVVRELIRGGRNVVGMTRTGSKRAALRELGAEAVVVDAVSRTVPASGYGIRPWGLGTCGCAGGASGTRPPSAAPIPIVPVPRS
jgi:nucleoside-diphosphate-sugar epimerase